MSDSEGSYHGVGASSWGLIDAVKLTKTNPQEGWALLHDIIETKPDMDQVDEDGFSALMYAVRFDVWDLIPYLVNAGASVDLKDMDGNTPLYYATMFRFKHVMEMLVSLGADPNTQDQYGLTLLQDAIDSQNLELTNTLLELGASPNTLSSNGTSPLLLALSHEHLPCDTTLLNTLLDAGGDPNIVRESDGMTPLMAACNPLRRNTHVVRLLIGGGANLELRDTCGRTALHHCAFSCNLPVLKCLVKAGANLNAVDDNGLCAMAKLANDLRKPRKDIKAISSLFSLYLQYGADPNIVTSILAPGELMSEVLSGLGVDGVKALLAHGADPRLSSSEEADYRSPFKDALGNLENLPTYLPSLNLLIQGLYYRPSDVKLCADLESDDAVHGLLEQMREIPLLQQLCRREVHRALGCVKHRPEVIQKLPTAGKLHRYIMFEEPE